MSRFYRGNDDSSSDSSSEEEELYSTEEEQDEVDDSSEGESDSDDSMNDSDSDESSSEDEGAKKTGANRFLIGDSDSDSDSDSDAREKVVKSAKDKRFEELEKITHVIENARKIGDWSTVATEYEKLSRQVTKLVIAGKAPKVYIQASADLEDAMNEAVAKAKVTPKKMTGPNSRGLNAVKQKVKKNNKEFQAQIDAYRADPDAFMSGSDAIEEAQKPQPKKVTKTVVSTPADVEEEEEDDEGFAQVGKGGKTVQYTPESILKHLRTILESRGKKNTDRNEQIKTMEKLLDIAITPYQKIRTLLTLVSTRFDLGSASNAMPVEQWEAAEKNLGQLLDVCFANPQWIIVENAEEWDDDEKAPTLGDEKYFKIPGSIVSYVERLDDEFTRSLQSIDPHTPEYIERLQDEASLYTVIFRGMLYYEFLQKSTAIEIPQESINRVVMRRLEHTYFKPESVIKVFEQNFWKTVGSEVESTITPRSSASDASKLVNTLCGYLFIHSEGILRARAMLCEVYFLALHGHYYRARDMSLMSHLQETIPNFDIQTQILYNRTLVQVGLCAFRKGLVYDAQNTLQEICGSGRQKELLAQGVMPQRYGQVSPEQERLEKQRQLPFHMHINLELLECVYLTCSMLLEIPLLAQTGSSPDIKKRVISKTYRRMLEYHERQIFTGPPENTRDHVMQASKTLAAGEWKNAVSFIHSIKIWDLMPNSQEIKAMLATQIQQDGLRTFLFTYAPFYDTLAISMLSEMFELSASKVSAVVSKMISHEELSASLDQASNNIIFRKGVELSRLQGLALALSDKASSLIESNERTLEQRTQGSANAFDRQGGRGRGGPRQQRVGRSGPRAGGNTQRQAGGTQFTGGALGAAVRG